MRRTLLLRIPNWLGDVVQALPVIEAAAADRTRGVLLLGPAPFGPVLTARYPDAVYIPWSRAQRFAPLGALRRARPGTALLLTDSLSSAILAALAGVPERIGYGGEWRSALLTTRVARSFPSRAAPRVEEYAALGRAAGLAIHGTVPKLEALPEDRQAARRVLGTHGLAGAPYAVFAPGASYGPAKRWPPGRFGELAARLVRAHGLGPVLVGTRDDRGEVNEMNRAAGGLGVDLAGATDLPALIGVLADAAITVSNDSGVMHLSAALGRPTLGVFGSTSPAWTSVDSPWVRNLYAAYPCSPCFRRTCPIGYGCLRSIETDQAARAAAELLAGSAA